MKNRLSKRVTSPLLASATFNIDFYHRLFGDEVRWIIMDGWIMRVWITFLTVKGFLQLLMTTLIHMIHLYT